MRHRESIETTNLDTLYGSQTIPWSRPRDALAVGAFGRGRRLSSAGAARRPAACGRDRRRLVRGGPVLPVRPQDPQARNVAAKPACTISARLPGMDLVFEGEARRVADTPTLEALAAV